MGKKRIKKMGKRIIMFVLLCVLVFLINLPIIYMIANSFKPLEEIMSTNTLWPQNFTLDNYRHVFRNTKILLYIGNSFAIATITTIVVVVVSSLAGYILSRFINRLTRLYGKFLLVLQVFPLILALIPLFVLFSKMNLINTKTAMVILYTAIGIPYSVQMFSAYFMSVPKEIEESAWIDGCSKAQTFFRIALPLVGPGLAAVTIYDFVLCWNEYMLASIFIKDINSRTLTVGISMFVSEFTSSWNYMFASATMAMIPIFVLFLFFQKYMIAGWTSGSVKG